MSTTINIEGSSQQYKGQVLGTHKLESGNSEVRPILIDKQGHISSIGLIHDKVHGGRMFFVNKVFRAVPNNTSVYIRHITGVGKELHSEFISDSIGKWSLNTYLNSIYSNNGVEVIPINRRSNSTYLVTSKFYHTPIITTLGDKRFEYLFGAGDRPNRVTSGNFTQRIESVFGEGVEVLIEFKNESGNPQDIAIIINAYEVDV